MPLALLAVVVVVVAVVVAVVERTSSRLLWSRTCRQERKELKGIV